MLCSHKTQRDVGAYCLLLITACTTLKLLIQKSPIKRWRRLLAEASKSRDKKLAKQYFVPLWINTGSIIENDKICEISSEGPGIKCEKLWDRSRFLFYVCVLCSTQELKCRGMHWAIWLKSHIVERSWFPQTYYVVLIKGKCKHY